MKFLFGVGSVLGWVFLIYFAWNKSIPGWFKFGVTETAKVGSELVKTIPTDDWQKPPEPEQEIEQKQATSRDSKPESENSKSLFSSEINVGPLRSKYNFDIKQDKKSEEVGRQDMGAKQ